MKISLICLGALLAGLVPALAESAAQKLRLKDLTGTSCSAEKLNVHGAPNGPFNATLAAPASVTVIRGQLDPQGESWVLVSNDKTKKRAGWVGLSDLSCI
jgi:hypothetical protein